MPGLETTTTTDDNTFDYRSTSSGSTQRPSTKKKRSWIPSSVAGKKVTIAESPAVLTNNYYTPTMSKANLRRTLIIPSTSMTTTSEVSRLEQQAHETSLTEMRDKVLEMARIRYATLSPSEIEYIKDKVASVTDGYYGGHLDDAQKLSLIHI